MARKFYEAKVAIEHGEIVDGKLLTLRVDAGDEIELDAEHAAPLLACGAIVDPTDRDGDGEPDAKPKGKAKTRA